MLRRGTLFVILTKLETKRLIRRNVDLADRRVMHADLTDDGSRMAAASEALPVELPLIWNAMVNRWQTAVQDASGLAFSEYRILALLEDFGGLNPSDISDRLFIERSNVSLYKRRLIARGRCHDRCRVRLLRFNNEDIAWTTNMAAQATACTINRKTYTVFDQAVLDAYTGDPADAQLMADVLADPDQADSIFSADSLEALSEHFGLDVETLMQSVDRYNSPCKSGTDSDFGKAPQFLKALEAPPFYMAKIINLIVVTDGGITTNIKAEALDGELHPIPGLYAVGLDGAMLWRNVYTQNMPGTQMGNNVNSGRTAARSAKEYIAAL